MDGPSKSLDGRRLILGVTGGIAAYKSAELVRLFKKAGVDVRVLLTADASRFVTPLTLGTLSQHPVLSEIFPEDEEGTWTKHIELGLWADLCLIAPATAQTISKLANGQCDSMVTAVALAARCPILVCPAMDHDMYLHPATQSNLDRLRAFGYEILPPEHGELASGLVGWGRLPDLDTIVARSSEIMSVRPISDQSLSGKRVLVTAGPTREAIDPVRFISNGSTGSMGFALAQAAAGRGADVTLIAGPSSLPTPAGVKRIDVVSATEMARAVSDNAQADVVIMAAAVADFRPATASHSKIKKKDAVMSLSLEPTTDILKSLGASKREGQVLIGFAMETDDAEANARAKLEAKNLDWIVVNNLREKGAGFGTSTNKVTLLGADGRKEDFPVLDKRVLASRLLDAILG
ncbi:MAG TPA: bifunctional phosphopantothenoylcysteine decarboxylase/phosphopantothenate--cysteine ligase CoaBC [Rhodothermales bacterium]